MSIEEFGYKDQLHRALTTKDLVIYGLIFMVPLAYLVGLIGMFFTALSTLVVAVISLLVGLLFASWVDDLTLIVNFGALTGVVLLHLSVINHFLVRRRSGDWLRHLIFPLLGLSIIVYVLYEMDRAAKILGLACIAIGLFYYLLLTLWIRKPAVLKV